MKIASDPLQLTLKPQEVHLWQVNLDLPTADLSPFIQILSPDEQQRAQRYYRKRDRDCFIVGRGTLRQILSQYTAQSPQQLQFTYGQKGKPALAGHPLQFNLSHSQDLSLVAVSQYPLGVDLEYIRPFPVRQLPQRFFHPQEYQFLTSLPT
jgi:4'-phosphopantetheinyl transferase